MSENAKDEAMLCCMIVTNPGDKERPHAWQRRVNDLIRGQGARIRELEARLATIERETLERAADACKSQSAVFLSPEYATGQPLSSSSERFACRKCEAAIRAMIKEKTDE